MVRNPKYWDSIPNIDDIDANDDDGELFNLFRDVNVYDIEEIDNFNHPPDKHNIKETIFIIRNNGEYYLCETQGENYIKFSTNISGVSFIKDYDRLNKVIKLYEKSSKN